jgi:uncharacterized protein
VIVARNDHLERVGKLLRQFRVVAIVGARQVGKTTLARIVERQWRGPTHYFDCEDPRDLQRLASPMQALEKLNGLVVIDEIQRRPGLFEPLRVLADKGRSRFLVLGSASHTLLRQGSESLAGRIAYHELGVLTPDEVGPAKVEDLWLRGGFPASFVATSLAASVRWRQEFVRTFLERDVPQFGITVAAQTLRRFWSMLAHVHGKTLNWSELGRSMAVTDNTIRHYVDLLADTFMVRLLQPWHANISKRQVKAPKVYLADSGVLHTLLDIDQRAQLHRHPKVGASWEGFCIEAIAHRLGARREECFFWATHAGAELDLLVVRGAKRRGFEIKYTDEPSPTASMRIALQDLGLDSIDVVYDGTETFMIDKRIRALPLMFLWQDLKRM